MICPKCKNPMRPGSLVCFRCGSRWTESELLRDDRSPEERQTDLDFAIKEDERRLRNREMEFEARQRERLAEMELDAQKKELEYDFKQRETAIRRDDDEIEFNRKRQSLFDQDELEARKEARQMDKLRQMAELKRQMKADKAEHEKEMAMLYAHMDADQILASQVKDMDPTAQAELAKSRDSSRVNDVLRDVIDRDSKKAEEEKDRMERMFERFADRLADVAGARSQQNPSQKQE